MALTTQDIDLLIQRLNMLKSDPEQHFHISSDYKGSGGLGDIEVYLKQPDEVENMWVGGKAQGPGSDV